MCCADRLEGLTVASWWARFLAGLVARGPWDCRNAVHTATTTGTCGRLSLLNRFGLSRWSRLDGGWVGAVFHACHQQPPAHGDLGFPMTICHEAEVTDPMEAGRQDMQQEAPDEL